VIGRLRKVKSGFENSRNGEKSLSIEEIRSRGPLESTYITQKKHKRMPDRQLKSKKSEIEMVELNIKSTDLKKEKSLLNEVDKECETVIENKVKSSAISDDQAKSTIRQDEMKKTIINDDPSQVRRTDGEQSRIHMLSEKPYKSSPNLTNSAKNKGVNWVDTVPVSKTPILPKDNSVEEQKLNLLKLIAN
jgi:hypothetical protein